MQGNLAGFGVTTLTASTSDTNADLQSPNIRQTAFAGIISQCPLMQRIFSVVQKVARTHTTVLVLG